MKTQTLNQNHRPAEHHQRGLFMAKLHALLVGLGCEHRAQWASEVGVCEGRYFEIGKAVGGR